jgi:hypothetical protein
MRDITTNRYAIFECLVAVNSVINRAAAAAAKATKEAENNAKEMRSDELGDVIGLPP